MPTATVTSKGQITIPNPVRDELGLREGDRVAFRVLEDGSVVVEPETVEILDLKGALKPKRKGIMLADYLNREHAKNEGADTVATFDRVLHGDRSFSKP